MTSTPGPGGPGAPGPDDRDLDDGGLDLTPRSGAAATPRRRTGVRRWGAIAVLGVLVVVVGVIVWQAKGATLYYKNADEAIAQKASLGTKTFRLQGTVIGQPEPGNGDRPTVFRVAYNGKSVKVVHTGSEPALFKAGLPVVVEGHWNTAGTAFDSRRLLVKHTEDYQKQDKNGSYEKQNPDRVVDADKQNESAS